MEPRLAPSRMPPRGPWPAVDDDDPAPIEEWTLDEVDDALELSTPHGARSFDAAFD